MNTVLKIFLSMSFSGSLLILLFLAGKRFLKETVSRQWQYYIWLIVILRLLLPFGPETSLMGKSYQAIDQAITQAVSLPQQQTPPDIPGGFDASAAGLEQNSDQADSPTEDLTAARPIQNIALLLIDHVWLIWLAVAMGMLIRKITVYQGFMRYISAGSTPVPDIEILDRLSIAAKRAGIQKPIELWIDPMISSPLLIGFFHPRIVLPSADLPEKNFQYIVLHELTHYKRQDICYKWLVQVTLCLHWFNPLVYLMSREITDACEFSCDEAVLADKGYDNAQDYGRVLLDAMAAVGKYREPLGALTLSENKQLLKERIAAVMNSRRRSTAIRILTGVLTLCMIFGASFSGIYTVAAASPQTTEKALVYGNKETTQTGTGAYSEDRSSQAEQYYQADSLPLFEIAFSHLDENAQKMWLERLYGDNDFAFFSAAVRGLGTNSALLAGFTEKAYADEKIVFFSTLTDCMNETELELWLDRALEDGNWGFQSMLFHRLNRDDEFDGLKEENEKAWAEAQTAEYRDAGVTMDGKNYYYRGQLVNVFLDIRANGSLYTLNTNPAGTIHIKINRDADNKITDVASMSEAEVAELLENMSAP